VQPKFEAKPFAKTRAVAPGKNQRSAGDRRFFFATRESGTVGICGPNCEIREELVLEIVNHVPKQKLILGSTDEKPAGLVY
jgi:hypothetical protein